MYTDAQQAVGTAETEIWSYGAGLSLPDLGKEGNLAAIFGGVEPYAAEVSKIQSILRDFINIYLTTTFL